MKSYLAKMGLRTDLGDSAKKEEPSQGTTREESLLSTHAILAASSRPKSRQDAKHDTSSST